MAVTVDVSYPADGVALIAFADPPVNFGTRALTEQLLAAMRTVEQAGTRVFVLASDTPGYFIAHWSLQQLVDAFSAPPPARSGRVASIHDALEASPMISIAANNGQAWGGGAELSWACDLRIAAESATYGQPEVALGIIPGAGGASRLAKLIGHAKCMELVLDCRPITAGEALALRAINRVVPDDRLREAAIAWAAHIAQWPAWALAAGKRSVIDAQDLSVTAARRNESQIFGATARRADALDVMRAAQARYDAGANSFEAIAPGGGLERRPS
jgi:enoyl-CoA hydratase/carnithine racemase